MFGYALADQTRTRFHWLPEGDVRSGIEPKLCLNTNPQGAPKRSVFCGDRCEQSNNHAKQLDWIVLGNSKREWVVGTRTTHDHRLKRPAPVYTRTIS